MYYNGTFAIQLILRMLYDVYFFPSVRGAGEPGAVAGLSSPRSPAVTQASQVLEEWQVPPKYRRAPITEEEIEYINVSFSISISNNMYIWSTVECVQQFSTSCMEDVGKKIIISSALFYNKPYGYWWCSLARTGR